MSLTRKELNEAFGKNDIESYMEDSNNDLETVASILFQDECNYNNADITNHICFQEHEILEALEQ